ncbi:unnamed protein product, partial [Meganyctiphanes norvegica]
PTALLSGTLQTFQRFACDDTILNLSCPENTTLDILLARYGRPGTKTDVAAHPDLCPPLSRHSPPDPKVECYYDDNNYKTLQTIISACHHKNKCNIQVSPETFSTQDPCPTTRKYIEVAYKCRPETFINKIVCQDSLLDLKCDRNSRLAIYNVLFGRSLDGSIMCPQKTGIPEEDCQASFATEMVMNKCHGQRTCVIIADPNTFGRPCRPESLMYMKTVYTCVPRKILKVEYQGQTAPDEETQDMRATPTIPQKVSVPPKPVHESYPASPTPRPSPLHPDPPTSSHSGDNVNNRHNSHHPYYNPTIKPTKNTKLQTKDKNADVVVGDYPQNISPHERPDVINCTITLLSGSKNPEIGFITEWMKAYAFIRKNFEKLILYMLIGLCTGILLFLIVIIGHLLLDRRRDKQKTKMMQDPLTSVFASDIDDIDGDLSLDMTGPHGSSTLVRTPPPHDPLPSLEVRYNTVRHSHGLRWQDSDSNPRTLSRTTNNQLYS